MGQRIILPGTPEFNNPDASAPMPQEDVPLIGSAIDSDRLADIEQVLLPIAMRAYEAASVHVTEDDRLDLQKLKLLFVRTTFVDALHGAYLSGHNGMRGYTQWRSGRILQGQETRLFEMLDQAFSKRHFEDVVTKRKENYGAMYHMQWYQGRLQGILGEFQ